MNFLKIYIYRFVLFVISITVISREIIAYDKFDQFLIPGCTLKTLPNNDVIQNCNGVDIPQIVFNNKTGGSFFSSSVAGSITGAKKVGNGMVWVQNASKIGSKDTVEVCESVSSLYGVAEECKRVSSGSNNVNLSNGMSVYVVKVKFTAVSGEGDIKALKDHFGSNISVKKGVHSDGYLFQLMSSTCPYMSTRNDGECKITNSIKGEFTKENNCYLLRAYISTSCPSENICPCDNNFSCDNNFKANGDNRLKDNSSAKVCYECHSEPRKMLKNCLESDGSSTQATRAYKTILDESVKIKLENSYGGGTYICAYGEENSKSFIRLGCTKFIPGIGPRPFPRIAKADDKLRFSIYPAAHLFIIYPFVKQFRDNNEPAVECDDGLQEVGEDARGTFFRPKIKVLLADTFRIITFNPNTTKSMTSVYGSMTYHKGQKMVSNWNEDIPFRLESSSLDKTTCVYTSTGYTAFICTRLEYDDVTGEESYVAYHAPSLMGQTSASKTCASLDSGGLLKYLGSVSRPPLKYSLDRNGIPLLPIYIRPTKAQGTDERYPVKITLDPKLAYCDVLGFHDDLSKMEIELTPSRYDPLNEDVVQGTNCAMLYNHKVCLEEDQCGALDYIDERVKDQADLSTCVTASCKIYKSLKDICERRTFCHKDYTTVAQCQQNTPQANLLNLEENFFAYTTQEQWTPSVCFTSGSIPIPDNEIKRLYGSFGDPGIEYGVEMFDPVSGYGGRLIKTFEMSNNSIHNNIMPVHSSYFEKGDITGVIQQLTTTEYEYNDSVAVNHFGANKSETFLKNHIRIRRRNMRELGGCLNFKNAASLSATLKKTWDPTPLVGPISGKTQVADIYIPLACTYLDLQFQGPGGGASSPGNSATIGFQNSGQGISSGSTGGYAVLVFNAMAQETTDFLRIIRGASGDVVSIRNRFGVECTGAVEPKGYIIVNWDYNATGILTPYQEIAYAYGGIGNVDIGDNCKMYNTGTIDGGVATRNENYFFNGTYLNANDKFNNLGTFSGNWTEIGMQGLRQYQTKNMFGTGDLFGYSGSTRTECNASTSFFGMARVCWRRSWYITRGGPGGALIEATRVRKSGINVIPDANEERDSECISMCPRMNIKMKLLAKDVMCEYGSAITSTVGVPFDMLEYDNQVPVGGYGIPTYCTDDEGNIYIAKTDMGIQKCPSGKVPYTGNNRLFGLCVSENSKNKAIETILHSDKTHISGAGIYCDRVDRDCSAIRYWDASQTKGIILEPSLQSLSKFGRKCLEHGMWAVSTGPNAIVPITILSEAKYKVIKPYLFSSSVNPNDATNGISTVSPNSTPLPGVSEIAALINSPPSIQQSENTQSSTFPTSEDELLKALLKPENAGLFGTFTSECPYIGGGASCVKSTNIINGMSIGNNCYLFREYSINKNGCEPETNCRCDYGGISCDSDFLPTTSAANMTITVDKNGLNLNSRTVFSDTGIPKSIPFSNIGLRAVKVNSSYSSLPFISENISKHDELNGNIYFRITTVRNQNGVHIQRIFDVHLNKTTAANWMLNITNCQNRIISGSGPNVSIENTCAVNTYSLIYRANKEACFKCLSPIRKAFDVCMINSQRSLSDIKNYAPITGGSNQNSAPVEMHSESVPYGYARGQSVNNIVNQNRTDGIEFKCPVIDAEKVPFDSLYSLNAIWPKSESGTLVQMSRCIRGFIPYMKVDMMSRQCSFLGIWRGLVSGGDKPCLYACPEIEDRINSIKWPSPINYSNPVSIPQCMPGKAVVYIGGVQRNIEVTTKIPQGINSLTWARRCVIPAASNPLLYSDVSSVNPRGKLPYWTDAPKDAKCVPASFLGECRTDRSLCYDSADDGEEAIAYCSSDTDYFVNGINVSPPTPIITNGLPVDQSPSNAYLKSNNITLECVFDSSVGSSGDMTTHYPFTPLRTPIASNIILVCADTTVSSFLHSFPREETYGRVFEKKQSNVPIRDLGSYSPGLAIDLETKIKNDIAIGGEECVLSKSHRGYDQISNTMAAYGLCSSVCFDTTNNRFNLFSCTDKIPTSQDISRCLQVCSTDKTDIFFSYSGGITLNEISGTGTWKINVANVGHCVNKAISLSLNNLRSLDPTIDLRVGDFCKRVIFSVSGGLDGGVIKTPVDNPLFEDKFDPNIRGCSKPVGCLLPNGIKIDHADLKWIVIGDDSSFTDQEYRFTHHNVYRGTFADGDEYQIIGNNVFVMRLGCIDNEVFLLEMLEPIGYDVIAPHMHPPISLKDEIRHGLISSSSSFVNLLVPDLNKFLNEIAIDTNTPIAYYLSLRRMHRKSGSEQTGNILEDEFGAFKTLANPLPALPAQIYDYSTVGNKNQLKQIFGNINLDGAINITELTNNFYIALNELNLSQKDFSFALWNDTKVAYHIKYVDNGWEISQQVDTVGPIKLAVGDESFENTNLILDFGKDSQDLGNLLRGKWILMCSSRAKNCTIKSLLTGQYILAPSSNSKDRVVEITTSDIARAAKFVISS